MHVMMNLQVNEASRGILALRTGSRPRPRFVAIDALRNHFSLSQYLANTEDNSWVQPFFAKVCDNIAI